MTKIKMALKAVPQPSTTWEEHVREARYQGRWAYHADLDIDQLWDVWVTLSRREGWDPAAAWSEVVEGFHAKVAPEPREFRGAQRPEGWIP